jgi:hypothetical protein
MSDSFAVKVVVCTLAIVTLGVVASVAFLSFTTTAIPDPLTRIGDVSLGALVGILAATRTSGAQPVEVVNEADQPVPVDETPRLAVRKRNP